MGLWRCRPSNFANLVPTSLRLGVPSHVRYRARHDDDALKIPAGAWKLLIATIKQSSRTHQIAHKAGWVFISTLQVSIYHLICCCWSSQKHIPLSLKYRKTVDHWHQRWVGSPNSFSDIRTTHTCIRTCIRTCVHIRSFSAVIFFRGPCEKKNVSQLRICCIFRFHCMSV